MVGDGFVFHWWVLVFGCFWHCFLGFWWCVVAHGYPMGKYIPAASVLFSSSVFRDALKMLCKSSFNLQPIGWA